MSLPLPTTQLVATGTTSMVLATRTSTGAPRVFTRGRLSLLTSLLLPTILLVAMDTTSMAPATLMSTEAPRDSTRGMPLAPAIRLSTALTATGTTARTPNTGSRSTAMGPTSTRTGTDTEALSGHAKEHENVPVVRLCLLLKAAHP